MCIVAHSVARSERTGGGGVRPFMRPSDSTAPDRDYSGIFLAVILIGIVVVVLTLAL